MNKCIEFREFVKITNPSFIKGYETKLTNINVNSITEFSKKIQTLKINSTERFIIKLRILNIERKIIFLTLDEANNFLKAIEKQNE